MMTKVAATTKLDNGLVRLLLTLLASLLANVAAAATSTGIYLRTFREGGTVSINCDGQSAELSLDDVTGSCGSSFSKPCHLTVRDKDRRPDGACGKTYKVGLSHSGGGIGRFVYAKVTHEDPNLGNVDIGLDVNSWTSICPFVCADALTQCVAHPDDCVGDERQTWVNASTVDFYGTVVPGSYAKINAEEVAITFQSLDMDGLPDGVDDSSNVGNAADLQLSDFLTASGQAYRERDTQSQCGVELSFDDIIGETDHHCGDSELNPCAVDSIFSPFVGLPCGACFSATLFVPNVMSATHCDLEGSWCPEIRRKLHFEVKDKNKFGYDGFDVLRLPQSSFSQVCRFLCANRGICAMRQEDCVDTEPDISFAEGVVWPEYVQHAALSSLPLIVLDIEAYPCAAADATTERPPNSEPPNHTGGKTSSAKREASFSTTLTSALLLIATGGTALLG